jgi:hypothetical protein
VSVEAREINYPLSASKAWLLPRLRALIEDAVFRADAVDHADDMAERGAYVSFAAALTKTLRAVEASE